MSVGRLARSEGRLVKEFNPPMVKLPSESADVKNPAGNEGRSIAPCNANCTIVEGSEGRPTRLGCPEMLMVVMEGDQAVIVLKFPPFNVSCVTACSEKSKLVISAGRLSMERVFTEVVDKSAIEKLVAVPILEGIANLSVWRDVKRLKTDVSVIGTFVAIVPTEARTVAKPACTLYPAFSTYVGSMSAKKLKLCIPEKSTNVLE